MASLSDTTKVLPGGTAPLNTQDNHDASHYVDADFVASVVTVFTGHGYLRSVRVNVVGTNAVKVRDGSVVKAVVSATALSEAIFGMTIQTSLILEKTGALGAGDLTVEFIKQ